MPSAALKPKTRMCAEDSIVVGDLVISCEGTQPTGGAADEELILVYKMREYTFPLFHFVIQMPVYHLTEHSISGCGLLGIDFVYELELHRTKNPTTIIHRVICAIAYAAFASNVGLSPVW